MVYNVDHAAYYSIALLRILQTNYLLMPACSSIRLAFRRETSHFAESVMAREALKITVLASAHAVEFWARLQSRFASSSATTQAPKLANTAIMGRVRTKTVKKSAKVIIERYYPKLTLDFETNKRICDEIAVIASKRLRNKVSNPDTTALIA